MNRIESRTNQGKRALVAVVAVALGLGAAGAVRANEVVYKKTALSTVWVERPDGGNASGFLVDEEQRLVVTARHVVARGKGTYDKVDVTFAQADEDGDVITDLAHYTRNRSKTRFTATVVYESDKRDLAILQLTKLPPNVKALPLAQKQARPGQEIHVIGNSTQKHGALFRYCTGKVSNVFRWDPPGIATVAQVVAHFAPTNQGDSGGPVVNNNGEVVAFVSAGTTGGGGNDRTNVFREQQVVDHSICVCELRAALKGLKEPREEVSDR